MKVKIKTGKGVLSKTGEPYAPNTIHILSNGWISPWPFTITGLLNALQDKAVEEIRVIDRDNVETTITIER